MKANAQKNQALIKQYPFVSDVLSTRLEPLDGTNGVRVDDLTIRVEKADGDLMYRRANNAGLGDGSCIFQLKGGRKDQVMRRGEYLFAIDSAGKIINRVSWPRNEKDRGTTSTIYGWTVLWAERVTFANEKMGYANPIWDKTKCLVWVTVNAWHEDTKNDDAPEGRFGAFRDRSMSVTIHLEPEGGFERLQNESSFEENLYIDSKVLMNAMFEKDHTLIALGGRIDELCQWFQDEVYFNGMKDVLDNGKRRGASGQFGPIKILCAELCGYDRVMLEDAMSYISFQLRPGAKSLYVLGMGGTLPQLRSLVKSAVKQWNEKPDLRAAFKPDGKISVI